ncbi:hypothetical protein D3C76_399410 [compost metagenome]
MQQSVGAVIADGIGYRPHIVRHIGRAAGVLGDHVVGLKPGKHRGIEGCTTGRAARQNFPHGLELAGVVSTVEHERDHVDHAVEAGDFRPGVVDVVGGVHRDPHVDPLVTVDQVIAPTALDQVAAVAAQDDVAGGKAGGR